jgi:lipoprotein-anchoring transpeptidase ErfK/SrfK
MRTMEVTAKTPELKSKVIGVFLFFAIFVMLAAIGWLVYTALYRFDWNSIEAEVDQVTTGNTREQTEQPSEESQLYTEKYEIAKTRVGNLTLSDYLVVVDVSEQKEYVFTKEGILEESYRISTGGTHVYAGMVVNENGETVAKYENRAMGESVWKVSEKQSGNLGVIYGPRLMMLDKLVGVRWIATEVALHGTNTPELLGTPTSLGCVNHDNADIIELYDMLDIGTLVVSIR